MGYNNYFPMNYQSVPQMYYQPQYQAPPQQAQANNDLKWVQGESGAKSYLVAPNTTVMLMDSEADVFYVKSADASGMPMPLRVFDYKERKSPEIEAKNQNRENLSAYVTKDEFEAFKGRTEAFMNKSIGSEAHDNE